MKRKFLLQGIQSMLFVLFALASTMQVNAQCTVGAASVSPIVCRNTTITNITHTTTSATGIGTATGLPAGVTAAWASNRITITGTPEQPPPVKGIL